MNVTYSVTERPAAHRRASGGENRRPARVGGLDGLRGIAITAVVAFHAFPEAVPGGFVGVDLFFVISGFLITRGLLVQQERNTFSFARFYANRVRRLLPALLLVLLVWSVVVLAVGGALTDGFPRQVVGALTFSSNWGAIAAQQSYFLSSAPDLLQHLWSLAVEEQFYLVWPVVLLVLLRRPALVRVAVVLGLAAASALAMATLVAPQDVSRVYFGTDTHSFGLLLGAAAALVSSRLRASSTPRSTVLRLVVIPSSLAAIGWAVFHLSGTSLVTYRGGLLLVAALAAVILATLSTGGEDIGTILDAGPLSELGRRSYGIYLWHWPFLVLASVIVPAEEQSTTAGVAVKWTAIGAALLCAWLSYRLVEEPFMRRDSTPGTGQPARVRRSMLMTAAVLTVAAVIGTTAAIAVRPSPATAAEVQIDNGARAIARHRHERQHADRPTAPTVPSARPSADPASAGPTVSASPTGSVPTVSRPSLPSGVTAIGDSVMLASAAALLRTFPDADIDAVVSRQPGTAPAILRGLAERGRLREVVIVGLGTNGALGAGTLAGIRSAIGDRRLVLVTAYADRPWIAGVDHDLRVDAATQPKTAVADWSAAIAAHPGLLGPDGIHPGAAGGRLYARTVADAVRAVQRD